MKTSSAAILIICCFMVSAGLSFFSIPLSFAGYKDIDRKIAESEISRNMTQNDVRFTFRLQKGGFDKGVQQGMWDEDGNLLPRATSSGIKSLKRSASDDLLITSRSASISFKVTGIKEMNFGMKFKQAEFRWWYNAGISSLWKRFIVKGGRGYVAFALRDDGWQYDGIEFKQTEEPFPRTKGEIAEEAREMHQREATKRKEEERERRLNQKRRTRMAESKKATREFGTFNISGRGGSESCRVSDAWVSCKKKEDNMEESYSLMFVDVRSIRRSYYPGPGGSKQYSAIEIEKRDTQGTSKAGDVNQDDMKTSWKSVTQWISESKSDVDTLYKALTRAHKTWRKKFRDIAE